jgi:photosystem II stability/assembly factor-like uncharacterized protein
MKILRNSILYVWATGIGMAQVGANSGWTFQNPQPTGNVLRAVAALNVKTMIAVGAQGSIFRTTEDKFHSYFQARGASAPRLIAAGERK